MISLGAVEAAINAVISDDIEVMATNIPDDKKGEKVVLLYTGDIDEASLKEHIANSELNTLMRPSKLIAVDAIPKLGSGKNDFNAAKKIAAER